MRNGLGTKSPLLQYGLFSYFFVDFFVLFFVFFRRVVSLFLGIFLGFVVVLLFGFILFSSVTCFSALYSFSFVSSVSASCRVTHS